MLDSVLEVIKAVKEDKGVSAAKLFKKKMEKASDKEDLLTRDYDVISEEEIEDDMTLRTDS